MLGGDVRHALGPDDIGPLSLERVRTAAALERRTHLPILVTGGRVGEVVTPVGVLMANSLAQDFATPVQWTEAESLDTWENARLSAAILQSAGIHSVFLVTHAWHERRGLAAFQHFGIDAVAAPVSMDRIAPLGFNTLAPNTAAWGRSYYALHEWIGAAWYALRS